LKNVRDRRIFVFGIHVSVIDAIPRRERLMSMRPGRGGIPAGSGLGIDERHATGQKALRELLSEGKIQGIGKGTKGDLFRYYAAERRDCK
jgi:hypothetical protein